MKVRETRITFVDNLLRKHWEKGCRDLYPNNKRNRCKKYRDAELSVMFITRYPSCLLKEFLWEV